MIETLSDNVQKEGREGGRSWRGERKEGKEEFAPSISHEVMGPDAMILVF